MSQSEELRQMFATMLRISPADLGPETSLAPLNTSLGGAKVRLGLKRLGLALPAGSNPMSFGALLSALSGEAGTVTPEVVAAPAAAVSAPPVPVAAAVGAGGLAGLQVGLDVEDVRELPVASDYWEHAFYRGSFSRSEISYAILQTDPRTHFAGFWCAKEALRKCDRSFASVSPAATAVAHESNGSPYLIFESDARFVRLPHSLSISHTAEMATAIVVAVPAATVAAAPVEAPVPAAGVVAVEAVSSPAEAVAPAKKAGGLGRLFVARQA